MGVTQQRLREALDLRKMTASELARSCGINKSAICKYLKGKITPKPASARSMAATLGVSPLWLMGFDEDMHKVEMPPIEKKEYNPIDYMKLTPTNRAKLRGYYQALLDTQE